MRILVTGGAGFIGSHLCESLLEQGHDVLCLDNLFSGVKRNIYGIFDNPCFEFIRHDITQPILLEVDQIYNLACPASPIHYQINPVKTVKTNVMGAINVLGMAKRVKARILQASTSEVYGDPEVHPQREDYWGNVNPIGPRSCYDEGKRLAETLMMDYHRQNGVEVRIARIFNTYGPKMSEQDGRVVSNLVVQALGGKPLTVYGDGTQTRSFCFVSDMVRGLEALMAQDFTGPVNLGNPVEITVLELAELVKEMTGATSEIQFKALPQDDPIRRRPDITVARRRLQWQPEVELRDGLRETIDYFQSRLQEK
ncbi:MAG: UDP-glucuronic acid decarboxylase family protein [Acidobacteriota bacterium]